MPAERDPIPSVPAPTKDARSDPVGVQVSARRRRVPAQPASDQTVRPVIDEAPRQVLPGYEDVVKTYYELLSFPAAPPQPGRSEA